MRKLTSTNLIITVIYLGCWVVAAATMPFHWFRAWRWSKRSSPTKTPTHSPAPTAWLRQEVTNVMERGVGYCVNTDCEDFSKGVFLLNHGDTFCCPRCRVSGHVEKERGCHTGDADAFKEVRVEFNFEPIQKKYREIAIVRDESLWGRNNVYTLYSALIKTEQRALKVAEAILANLNRYPHLFNGEGVPRTTEVLLSWDEPLEDFTQKLHQISKAWAQDGDPETMDGITPVQVQERASPASPSE